MAKLEINSANVETERPKLDDGIQAIIDAGGTASVVFTKKNNGTLPMLRLWRMWMKQMCEYMNANGNTMPLYYTKSGEPFGTRPMTPEDCHHAFTYLCMPCDESGERLSWALSEAGSNKKRVASTGERLRAMDRMWMIGVDKAIPLINPQDSEYNKLKQESES